MNILIANWTWYPSGGDWTYIDSICKIYESNGHTIIPFSVQNEKNFKTPYSNYFIEGIDYNKYYKKIAIVSGIKTFAKSIYSVESKNKLQLLLSETKIDIAQLNNISSYQTPSIIPVLKKAKIPIVWRILDYRLICPNSTFLSNGKICEDCYKHKYYMAVVNKCKKESVLASAVFAIESYAYYLLPYYKQVDMFLFQSEFTRDMFVKFGYDIKKTYVIENSYDSSNIQPNYQGKDYILYFGRLSQEKGILTLLDSMKMIPNVLLKIVGDGPESKNYVDYANENSITNVTFLGPKWGAELEPIIKDCEFVIVPSEWYEPSPYVVLQSFAYGKPVVASSIGGLKDLILNNKNGLLFKAGDSISLAQTISNLMTDKNLIREMGANARIILEKKYNSKRYYSETITVFTNLINSK